MQATPEPEAPSATAIALRHGERFAIGGIPMNTTYVVTESGRDGYHLEYVVDMVHGDRPGTVPA